MSKSPFSLKNRRPEHQDSTNQALHITFDQAYIIQYTVKNKSVKIGQLILLRNAILTDAYLILKVVFYFIAKTCVHSSIATHCLTLLPLFRKDEKNW